MKGILSILVSTVLIGSAIYANTPRVSTHPQHISTPADTLDTLKVGCATVIQNHNITTLVKKHIAHNNSQKTTDGFRVEIYSGTGNEGKNGSTKTRTDFLTAHPDMKAYLYYNQPSYAIRVGDFKDRIDAIRFLQKIKEQYPEAIVVREKVLK